MTILSIFFGLLAWAQPEPNFQFKYVPAEGLTATGCTHRRIRDLPDWEVNCDAPGLQKRFVAHVVMRETIREKTTSLEVLYWVTQRGLDPATPPKFQSTTARMHFSGQAAPQLMTFEQGVENDGAFLQMEWKR